ncbi:MAG: hypothetical protein WD691_11850 [Acidimicrobiales bacterium]
MTETIGESSSRSPLSSLGDRAQRRAEPRASIAIAGAGCALAVLGALVIAGDTGASDGDFNQVPGIVLSTLIVAAGFFTLSTTRRGPIATAGAAAAALGVPPLMFFVTWSSDGFPPYSTDGILIVSTLAWLGSYAVGPGRGRPFFLGAGLIALWFTVLQLTEKIFEAPFGLFNLFGASMGGSFDGGSGSGYGSDFGTDVGFSTFHAPDPTTLGILSLGLGLGYLFVCRRLDKRELHGAATPFALATLPTLFVGTALMGDDLEQAGTGLLLALVGAGLAYHGATTLRRVTAWAGGGATAFGAAIFLGDMTDDATVGGMLFIAAGIGLVAGGHAIAAALSEPDEMTITLVGSPDAVAATSAPEGEGFPPE